MTQQFNITEARELHAKTTQGEWWRDSHTVTCGERIMCYCFVFSKGEEHIDNSDFIAYAHRNWQAMLDTIERQAKEIAEMRVMGGAT